jgi:hypothetical protein
MKSISYKTSLNMRNLRKIVVFSGLMFMGSLAHAGLAQSSGAYLEGNIGFGPSSHFMGDANLGYKICDFFAVEGGFADFGKIDHHGNNYFFDAAAKGIMPFGNGFELFGKLGMAHANSGDDSNPVLFGGVGVGYAFTPNLSGTVQGFTTTQSGGVPSMYAGTVGLTYIF